MAENNSTIYRLLMFVSGGVIIFSIVCFVLIFQDSLISQPKEFIRWIFRILIAFAASMISIAIPGSITINYQENKDKNLEFIDSGKSPRPSLADKAPKIVATGAIAVFVLVYLFDPITSSAS